MYCFDHIRTPLLAPLTGTYGKSVLALATALTKFDPDATPLPISLVPLKTPY